MSVNIFGSRFKTKPLVDLSVNSKFITLTKSLQEKVNKTGDTLSGNLDMGNYKINNLADPISDGDACSKKFIDTKIQQESIKTKSYVDTWLDTKLDRETYQDTVDKFEIYKQMFIQSQE